MRTKLTRTADGLAVVIEQPLIDQLGLDETSELELSATGKVLVIQAVDDDADAPKLEQIMEELDAQYGAVFRRLAK